MVVKLNPLSLDTATSTTSTTTTEVLKNRCTLILLN